MKYIVKNEFVDLWSSDAEFAENPIVEFEEIERLANEWGLTVDELLNQVDAIYESVCDN